MTFSFMTFMAKYIVQWICSIVWNWYLHVPPKYKGKYMNMSNSNENK